MPKRHELGDGLTDRLAVVRFDQQIRPRDLLNLRDFTFLVESPHDRLKEIAWGQLLDCKIGGGKFAGSNTDSAIPRIRVLDQNQRPKQIANDESQFIDQRPAVSGNPLLFHAELLRHRLKQREGHYMPESLVHSQLEARWPAAARRRPLGAHAQSRRMAFNSVATVSILGRFN